MKSIHFSVSLLSLLPLLAAAAPAPDPMPDSLESNNKARTCKIVNVDNSVNCRSYPEVNSAPLLGIKGGEKHKFDCYAKGDCYSGVCTWDRITFPEYKITCYINGYFTDENCSSSILPKCKSI